MQYALDYGQHHDVRGLYTVLRDYFGRIPDGPGRRPVNQLVRSLIASKTLDRISDAAFDALLTICQGDWGVIADMPVNRIEYLIREVTRADTKAVQLKDTLLKIRSDHPDFDLCFLGAASVLQAQAWLERHDGIGGKVSSAVLNFSTLSRQSFVADTHVLRVFVRYGFIEREDANRANQFVIGAMPDWTPADLRALHCWVKRLGQEICVHRRLSCGLCPVAHRCWRLLTRRSESGTGWLRSR